MSILVVKRPIIFTLEHFKPASRPRLQSLSLALRKQAAMGVVSNVIVQGVISFVILGSLKRAGVIRWGLERPVFGASLFLPSASLHS